MLDPTATHLPVFEKLFEKYPIKTVLEFGCGEFSTSFFIQHASYVTAIEMQSEDWYKRVKKAHPSVDLRLALGPFKWKEQPLMSHYDLIFVDGHGDSRPECINWAQDRTDIIVAHDTEHPYYRWELVDVKGFTKHVYDELSPTTTVWVRE